MNARGPLEDNFPYWKPTAVDEVGSQLQRRRQQQQQLNYDNYWYNTTNIGTSYHHTGMMTVPLILLSHWGNILVFGR